MTTIILGQHPGRLDVRLVEGDARDLVGTLTDQAGAPTDWPAPPTLEFAGATGQEVLAHVATTDGPTASWSLTLQQVAAIAELERPVAARLTVPDDADPSGRVEYAGRVSWNDGWTAGDRTQRVTFTLPGGPPGAPGAPGAPGETGMSAYDVAVANGFVGDQAAWLASLVGPPGEDGTGGGATADALIIVAGGTYDMDATATEGRLVGFRVKQATVFAVGEEGEVLLAPGAYTFEREMVQGVLRWTWRPAPAGTPILPAEPDGWTLLATDTFTAPDDTPMIGRSTTTGGLVYTDKEGSNPDVRIRGGRATFQAFSYGNTLRIPLGADHPDGLRVSFDFEFYGVAPQSGSINVLAGTEWTPHSAGIVLDQNGGLALAGSVPPKNLVGATSGHPASGRLSVEWTPANVIIRINGEQVATCQMDSPLKGQLIDLGFGSNAVAIDNLTLEEFVVVGDA